MAKWRKKPVIIEAEVYKKGMEDGFKCREIMCERYLTLDGRCLECEHATPYINTLEGAHCGMHYISPGDYIITGVKGERYPCKPYIFHMTYEPVEDD